MRDDIVKSAVVMGALSATLGLVTPATADVPVSLEVVAKESLDAASSSATMIAPYAQFAALMVPSRVTA